MNRSNWNAAQFLLAVTLVTGLILAVGAGWKQMREVPSSVVLRSKQGETLANPETGAMQMRTADGGIIDFGGGQGSIPGWIPTYPGLVSGNVFSMRDRSGGGSVGFVVDASATSVCDGYPARLKKAGLQVRQFSQAQQGGCMLLVEEPKQNLAALFSIGTLSHGAAVNVTYTKK